MKRIFNPENWNRKEHFDLFSNLDNPYVGVVAEVDCTKAYNFSKENGISFFALYLFSSMQAENSIEEFKYRLEDGEIFIYDHIDCGTTIGRKDGTFGFAFIPYSKDFETFNQKLQQEIKEVEECIGLHVKNEDLTLGLVRHSTFPWSRFTGLTQPSNFGTKESIPRIIFGKAYQQGDKMMMPVSVEANHGFVDGLHLANYLANFEKELSKF